MKALRHRVPAGTPEELAQVADEAFSTVVEVMRGNVRKNAYLRLSAAKEVRIEVCGPSTQRLEHVGKDGAPLGIEVHYVDPPADKDPDAPR